MAAALYLVTRASGDEGKSLINGVFAVLINDDNGETDAQRIAAATTQVNAANLAGNSLEGPTIFPDNYFDTCTLITTASGHMNTDANVYIFGGIGTEVAATSYP